MSPTGDSVSVTSRQVVIIGSGPAGLTAAIAAMPDKEAAIIAHRQKGQATNMQRTIEGIRDLAETQTT